MGGPVSGLGQYSCKLNGVLNYFHFPLQHHVVDVDTSLKVGHCTLLGAPNHFFVVAFVVIIIITNTISITIITIFIFFTFEYSSSSSVLLHLLIEELQDTDLTFSSI